MCPCHRSSKEREGEPIRADKAACRLRCSMQRGPVLPPGVQRASREQRVPLCGDRIVDATYFREIYPRRPARFSARGARPMLSVLSMNDVERSKTIRVHQALHTNIVVCRIRQCCMALNICSSRYPNSPLCRIPHYRRLRGRPLSFPEQP